MIKGIILKNWKSFDKSILHIDPITALIGSNASGKSNALDALSFLNRLASGLNITSILKGDANIQGLRGGLEWSCKKPGDKFTIGVLSQEKEDERTEYSYEVEVEVGNQNALIKAESLQRIKYRPRTKKNPYKIWLFRSDKCEDGAPSITARLYNEKQGKPFPSSRTNAILYQLSTQKQRQEIMIGVNQVVNDLKNLFILDPIPSHMRDYQPLSDQLSPDASNIAGVLAALNDQKKGEIEKTISSYIKDLPEKDISRVYAEKVGKFGRDAMLYCDEHWGVGNVLHPVDARGLSDGTLRFLGILTALLTRPGGSLLVVEEIDNGLHPSRSSLLLKMLKDIGIKRNVDILFTTHNPALLDAMGPEMMPFITVSHRREPGYVSELTLLEDLKQLPKLLAAGSIGKLSSQGRIEAALKKSDDV